MNAKRTRNDLRLLVLLAAAVAFAGVPAAFADQVVYFQNGKAIMVKSVEKGDKLTILEMEGGGKIGVPSAQIVRIEDYVVTATGGTQTAAAPVPQPAAPVAAAPRLDSPAQANAGTQPLNQPSGTGFGGAPLAASQGGGIPAPLAIGTQGQGAPAGQQIRARYPMSPLQGLARGGPEGRMETPVVTGPGAGRQMSPIGFRPGGRGIEGRMPPGAYAQPLRAAQAAQAQAAQLRAARPQAPPLPPSALAPPSQPAIDAATADEQAAADDQADDTDDTDDTDADTPDDETSVEN
jgi:hypothetical protein